MKNFSIWLFYLTAPIASVFTIFENMPPHPWFFTTQMQRLQPRPLTVIPRPRPTHRQDISKFFYWKHLLELECFKELCGHYKERSGNKRPSEMIGRKPMPAFRNDGTGSRDHAPVFFKINGKQVQSEPQNKMKYSGNERIILWPPERNFTEKQWKVFPIKQGFDRGKIPESTGEKAKENLEESTAWKDYIRSRFPVSFPSRTTEAPSETFPEKDSQRKINPAQGSSPQLFHDLGLMPFSTSTHSEDKPYKFMHRVHPSRIQPYEVEEIVEEKVLVDVDENDKDEGGFESVAEKNVSGMDSPEMGNTEHFQNIIDNSVNKILKGLMSPVMETPSSPDKDVLPLEKHERHHGGRQQIPETTPKIAKKLFKPDARVESSRGFDLNTSFKEGHSRSFLATDPPKKPAVTDAQITFRTFNTKPFQSRGDSGRESLSVLEKVPPIPPIEALKNLDLLMNLMANRQPNFTPTEEMDTTTQKTFAHSANAFTHSFPPFKTSHLVSDSTEGLLPTTEFSTTDSNCSDTDTAPTTQDFPETVQYFSAADANDVSETERVFMEFSDRPISFDLLTTTIKLDSEKDQETIWKSSRRMHFGHESPRTTVSNEISATLEGGQRRSDILITDDLADYEDDENNLSTLGYLERLKQDNSLHTGNLTLDALIPFIPVLINDLRENKIPSEDIPILSRALGKYWTPVLALSNFTNLDMLPLVKMKDERDLENVLQNFLPEDKSPTTTGTTENEAKVHDDYNQSYDYLEEYKDLYKDMLGQEEMGDKRRKLRPRRDAEDDLKTLEATREYFDSIEEERADEGSDYIFEDIIYDEMSEGEDSSVFELMEVSDVHIDKEM